MNAPETVDLRPADWALIVEALVTWAGNPTDLEGPREERAFELVHTIADAHGLTPGDLVTSRDTGWDGDEV